MKVEAAKEDNTKCLRGPEPLRTERNFGSTVLKLNEGLKANV